METSDVPDRPLTPAEQRGNDMLRDAVWELRTKRRSLNADELYEMRDFKPRVESEMRLPDDERGRAMPVFMFTLDGRLRGEVLAGCPMAGEAMLIQAPTVEAATAIAKDGVQATIEALREFHEQQPVIEPADPLKDGLSVDGAGRKARPGQPGGELRTDPTLKRLIASIIGGEPWKG